MIPYTPTNSEQISRTSGDESYDILNCNQGSDVADTDAPDHRRVSVTPILATFHLATCL